MANGVSAFRGIQAGKQAGFSDASNDRKVAATIYMLGTMQLTPQSQFYNPREERNSRVETHRVVPVARHSELRFESSAQFQRLPHWFSMMMGDPGGLVSVAYGGHSQVAAEIQASINTNNTAYTGASVTNLAAGDASAETNTRALYTFAPDSGRLVEPTYWTFEYGDNAQYYQVPDAIVRSATLRYNMNDAMMLSVDIFGKFVNKITRTTGVPQPPANDAVSQFTDVYIGDPSESNLQAFTQKWVNTTAYNSTTNRYFPNFKGHDDDGSPSNTVGTDTDSSTSLDTSTRNPLLDMRKADLCNAIELTIPTGFEMTRYTSGSIDFTTFGQMVRTVTANLTLRHSTDGRAEFDKYVNDAERQRLFRFLTKGPAYRDDHVHKLVIDLTALYSESPQFFTEQGGDDLFTMQASGYHEPNKRWDRDIAVHIETNRPNLKSDSPYTQT